MGLGLRRDIAKLQAILIGVSYGSQHISLKEAKHEYEQAIKLSKDMQHSNRMGKNSEIILTAGCVHDYVEALAGQFHVVKAERLAKEFKLKCRRFLGPEHHTTKCAVNSLEHCKQRFINWLTKDHKHVFIALKLVNGGGHICAFKHVDTNTQTMTIKIGQYSGETYLVTEFYFACDIVFPLPGCPVICPGQKAATNLNGKLGALRSDMKHYTELARGNESLKSASVKLENLRIVFDLDRFD